MTPRRRIAQIFDQSRDNDRQSRLINLLLILLIALNVIAIVLESVTSIHARFGTWFWYFELFSVAIFTLEYLARVWSCPDFNDTKDDSPIIGRLKYIFTPMALVDLAAILPFYLSLYMTIDLRFLRALRMLRLFKLTRYSPALSALLDVVQQESEALISAIFVLLMMLIVSACGIYLLETELQPETFGSIPDAMWWAMATLTTVGYGDVVPISPLGKIFGGIIGLIGIGMVALPAAILASGFAQNLQQRKQKYSHFVQQALHDGKIDEHERWQLEELRRELGLDSQDAMLLLDSYMRRIRPLNLEKCPHCGETLDRRKPEQQPDDH